MDAVDGRAVRVRADGRPEEELATVRSAMQSRKPGANRSTCASMRDVMSTVQPFGTWQSGTERPARASAIAAASPVGPDPTTTAS